MYELNVVFATHGGDDAHVGYLAFLFARGKEDKVARAQVFDFYFCAY
jgi:hypothetical protein